MKSTAVEQQPELESLSFSYQGLSTSRGGVGVGRSHVTYCFQWIWAFKVMINIIINDIS